MKIVKEKRGLGDCPQGFDFVFVFDFDFHAPFDPKQDSRVVFAGILRRRAPARFFRNNHAGKTLRIKGA
ncbi:MAG: hypothetical protein HQL73_05345 [Magnetococcales bacterium]|nr:hypothetical protein [Magnetococcales bacterium]